MTIAVTLLAKERGGPRLVGQVLFYPVTDASFETGSYLQFAEGYFLQRAGMQWFWDQYTTSEAQRNEITASPLRASLEQLGGLPPVLVITGPGTGGSRQRNRTHTGGLCPRLVVATEQLEPLGGTI